MKKSRMLSALKGESVDRPPIWLREGFNIGGAYLQEPGETVLGKGVDAKYRLSWKHDTLYRELFNYVSEHAEAWNKWGIGDYLNRFLLIPPKYISRKTSEINDNTIRINGKVITPTGELTFIDEVKKGINTYWHTKYLVNDISELKKIAKIPFEIDKADFSKKCLNSYNNAVQNAGVNGVLRLDFPSPIAAISNTMSLENFLMFSATEKDYIHTLLEIVTDRMLTIIDAVFKDNNFETTVNLGGSEICTPPMMSPLSFDEFIVPYDGRVIKKFKEYGLLVNMHCHSTIKYALKKMVDMGVDSTDPVEPEPMGNVTYEEARIIADGKITLIGNLEYDELVYSDTSHIIKRIKEILQHGKDRLIIGASAGPISKIDQQTVDNYKAVIDTVIGYNFN